MAVQKMYILPGGFLNMDRSILLAGVGMGKKIKAPIYSILLIHDEGPILIDAGLNPDGLANPEQAWGPRANLIQPELTKADDIRSRLKALNLHVSDIKKVILTHLHWDHTGGLRFFTHCPIIVQKEEYRFAFNPDSFVSSQYMPNHFPSLLNYHLLEGDQMILPGISAVKTPGHTPGHQSIIVKLASGASYIFPGDTISLAENLTLKIPTSNNWNSQQAMDSIYRLENLADLLAAEIIPSHDISKWGSLKKSPEFYP
jgi:N-acyl homoserine lactone hydrolase